MYIPTMHIFVN